MVHKWRVFDKQSCIASLSDLKNRLEKHYKWILVQTILSLNPKWNSEKGKLVVFKEVI